MDVAQRENVSVVCMESYCTEGEVSKEIVEALTFEQRDDFAHKTAVELGTEKKAKDAVLYYRRKARASEAFLASLVPSGPRDGLVPVLVLNWSKFPHDVSAINLANAVCGPRMIAMRTLSRMWAQPMAAALARTRVHGDDTQLVLVHETRQVTDRPFLESLRSGSGSEEEEEEEEAVHLRRNEGRDAYMKVATALLVAVAQAHDAGVHGVFGGALDQLHGGGDLTGEKVLEHSQLLQAAGDPESATAPMHAPRLFGGASAKRSTAMLAPMPDRTPLPVIATARHASLEGRRRTDTAVCLFILGAIARVLAKRMGRHSAEGISSAHRHLLMDVLGGADQARRSVDFRADQQKDAPPLKRFPTSRSFMRPGNFFPSGHPATATLDGKAVHLMRNMVMREAGVVRDTKRPSSYGREWMGIPLPPGETVLSQIALSVEGDAPVRELSELRELPPLRERQPAWVWRLSELDALVAVHGARAIRRVLPTHMPLEPAADVRDTSAPISPSIMRAAGRHLRGTWLVPLAASIVASIHVSVGLRNREDETLVVDGEDQVTLKPVPLVNGEHTFGDPGELRGGFDKFIRDVLVGHTVHLDVSSPACEGRAYVLWRMDKTAGTERRAYNSAFIGATSVFPREDSLLRVDTPGMRPVLTRAVEGFSEEGVDCLVHVFSSSPPAALGSGTQSEFRAAAFAEQIDGGGGAHVFYTFLKAGTYVLTQHLRGLSEPRVTHALQTMVFVVRER